MNAVPCEMSWREPCFSIREARMGDLRALVAMQRLSLRVIGGACYSHAQIESFLEHTPTMDRVLLEDRTYYVAEVGTLLVGCGGWSLREPSYAIVARLHGPGEAAPAIPKVRAMYVHPDFTRRGIGAALLAAIHRAILAADYAEAELDALLPGVPLYARSGYAPVATLDAKMPDGVRLPIVRMRAHLRADRAAAEAAR